MYMDDELRALFDEQAQCVLHERWARFDELSAQIDAHLTRVRARGAQGEARRRRECMACQHQWDAPVTLSAHTTNLSGEATVYCPKCNSRALVSSPVYYGD